MTGRQVFAAFMHGTALVFLALAPMLLASCAWPHTPLPGLAGLGIGLLLAMAYTAAMTPPKRKPKPPAEPAELVTVKWGDLTVRFDPATAERTGLQLVQSAAAARAATTQEEPAS
ncbi:hypothetical protein [Nonomuraea sp. NPDC005650]|uniref:hypothetical protein n=1 Tax=Nonomuraea sp. NPDC005650 TaxID=3157045 RepID=UPI0033A3AB72